MFWLIAGLALLTVWLVVALAAYVQECKRTKVLAANLQMVQVQYEALRKNRKNTYDVGLARATLKGQIAEQFAPLLPGFKYQPKDFRFLGSPFDGVIIVGLTEAMEGLGEIEEIVLCDIKMGNARLSPHQKAIKQAVDEGRVRWETIHVDSNYQIGNSVK